MNNVVKPLFHAHVRPVKPEDFPFIRALAAEFPTFTVPSEYMLWFFSHYHPEFCRVLEAKSGELKAYLLAMPTSEPQNGIAIWQLAAAQPNQSFALEYFAAYLRDLVEHTGVMSISFTATEDDATFRLIRSLAKHFFEAEVAKVEAVPAGQGEHEFLVRIRGIQSDLRPKPSGRADGAK